MFRTLILMVLLSTLYSSAAAHSVTVDGLESDWLSGAGAPNSAKVAFGEFTWTDVSNDSRTDVSNPETDADLLLLGISGDLTNAYFRARFATLGALSASSTLLQISLDRSLDSAGQTLFAAFGETQVAPSAAWERLILANSEANTVSVLEASFAEVATGPLSVALGSGLMEFSVPWASLGIMPGSGVVRLSAAVFRALPSGVTVDIESSDALDVMTDVGPMTFDEISDNVVNFSVDLAFDANGNVVVIPEPSTNLLVAFGIVLLALIHRFRCVARRSTRCDATPNNQLHRTRKQRRFAVPLARQ